ncbi:MAG TPA: DNA mismatch repair protein MutT, partial [Ruminococcus sp.]|nr:DNA mismatch repair protein MutT [Ruminococcus sp.]
MDKKIVTEVKGIVCCRGRILVLKRSEFETAGANEWEFPGGRI